MAKISPNAPIFKEVADLYGLDEELLKGIVATESDFRIDPTPRWEPHLNEHSYGLGQLLKSTAVWIRFNLRDPMLEEEIKRSLIEIGNERKINALLNTALINLHLTSAYLDWLRGRFGNNMFDLAAAYNAGSIRLRSTGEYVNQEYVDRFKNKLEEIRDGQDSISS